ncbi:MAG: glycosyltransferase family 4 protein [Luminiphilus sp.]|nr:glycosyltransferase family 4 protein [Luminiphilus sp.]
MQTPDIVQPEACLSAEKPLRIALLGYRSAPFSGGQGVYLRYLSQALVALGHEVTVISGPPYPQLVEGVALVKLPSLDLYARPLSSVTFADLKDRLGRREWISKLTGGFVEPWTFAERAREWLLRHASEFDVIHDNQTLADGILDLQRAGLPVITTIHHPITRDLRVALASEPRWWWRLLIRRWHSFLGMQASVARQLSHIVTVSRLSATDIATDFGVMPAVLKVIPNGVDTALFRPLPEVARQSNQIIATASADAPLKGLSTLLHAVGKLTQKRPELRLVLIARPKPGGDTERVIDALGLAERIQFVGGATHEEINQLYAESAAAVVPSLYEGFGLPAVEAMSAGIPLISSDGGALAEVVGEGGLLVPAGDSEALAAGLQRVLSDADLARELSNRGLRRARQQFCWSVCAQQMVDEYRACISRC